MKGISVTGLGEVTATPNTLTVDLGVSVLRPSVQTATAEAAGAANALIAALEAAGVAKEYIATTNYSIRPESNYRNDQQQFLGYRVANTVRVMIKEVDMAGSIIDAASGAAGDLATVNNISFSIHDDSDAMESARSEAWKDALQKAEQLAQLAGRSLGPARSIDESHSRQPAPIEVARMRAAEVAPTPITPGSSTVSVSLRVDFDFAT